MSMQEQSASVAQENLYFAYGSNVSPRRLLRRLGAQLLDSPDLPHGIAVVPAYCVRFHKVLGDGSGAADLVERDECSVLPPARGLVWRVSAQGLRLLDDCEGVSWGHYRRVRQTLTLVTGEMVDAWAYLAEPSLVGRGLRPSRRYLQYLLDGARRFLSPDYHAWLKGHRCAEDVA